MNLEDFLKETITYKRYELKLAWINFKIEVFGLKYLRYERDKLIEHMNLFLKGE